MSDVNESPLPALLDPSFVPRPLPPRARLTMVASLIHQSTGGHVTPIEYRSADWLGTDEVPYLRPEVKVGAAPLAVESGWIPHESVGVLAIKNNAKNAESIVEVGLWIEGDTFQEKKQRDMHSPPPREDVFVPLFFIQAGHLFSERVVDLRVIRLRCPEGMASCQVVIFPT